MNANVETALASTGDRGWFGFDADRVFSRPELSDDALTASEWAARKFHATFPGWQLYRRANAGMTVHDDELDAWVVGGARLLARARKINGRCYVEKRGPWIDQAARDALATAVRLANIDLAVVIPAARARAAQFGVEPRTWLKIYKPMLACMVIGLNAYTSELHYQYRQVKFHIDETGGNLSREAGNFARVLDFQSGNRLLPHATDSDGLHPPLMPDALK